MIAQFTAGDALRRGAVRSCLGAGLGVRLLLHHQNAATPSTAIRMAPTIVSLMAQRIASFAIRKKIASRIMPAIRKMVVKVIRSVSVVSGPWSVKVITG
jgi:hypothetical protein